MAVARCRSVTRREKTTLVPLAHSLRKGREQLAHCKCTVRDAAAQPSSLTPKRLALQALVRGVGEDPLAALMGLRKNPVVHNASLLS